MKLFTAVAVVLLLVGVFASSFWFVGDASSNYANFLLAPIGQAAVGLFALAAVSFYLARRAIPRVQGRAVAAALLVVGILLVPTGLLFTTSQVGCLGPCGQYFPTVTITGTIVVPPGSDNGTMTVQLVNSGANNTEILGLTVTNLGANYHGAMPNNNVSAVAMNYRGNLVSATNALPKGDTATASIQVVDVVAGATYTIHVSYIYGGGSGGWQPFDIQAPNALSP